jgi:hypothetical protein
MIKELGWLLIAMSIIFQMVGGVMDIYKKDELSISKEHVFADALFLLVLGFGLILIDKKSK